MPKVSLLIICRNEEKYIESCLNSIEKQTYPRENMEVLLIDGMSEDRTREIAQRRSWLKILDNPKRIFASGCNVGIRNSSGELVIIMGAHTEYHKDYVSKCEQYSLTFDIENVGGNIQRVPFKDTLMARAICLSMRGRFGKGKKEERLETFVDTIYGGCYKREVFKKIGLFNESLRRSSDMEFNIRLKKADGEILMSPEIKGDWYQKDNLRDFLIHNFEDGIWTTYPLKFRVALKLRHYIPLVFILTFPLNFWLYFSVLFYQSFKIALREKDYRLLFLMPVVFTVRHVGYGLGSVWGIVKLSQRNNKRFKTVNI